MNASLFDGSAAEFAANADAQLMAGNYARGRLFISAIQNTVAPGGRLLDYGCGPGRIAYGLASAGYKVTGVDPSSGMIEQAKKRIPAGVDLYFVLADDEGRSLATAAYDAIVCSSVIEYVPEPLDLLQQFVRALQPRGILVLSFANRLSLWRRYSAWRYARVLPHLGLQHNLWSFGECAALLRQTGFEVLGNAKYFDCAPLDRRRWEPMSRLWWLGTLGLVVARVAAQPPLGLVTS